MKSVDVVIVGGGPVGMHLAMNLEALGVRSMIVDRSGGSRDYPRGNTHNCRTMEHFRRLGISKQVRQLRGLPADHPTDVVYKTALNGLEICRLPMPSEAQKQEGLRHAAVTDQVPEPILRCNQMYVEKFVFDHVHALPAVECRWEHEFEDFEERPDGVTVSIADSQGRRETVDCRFLVGCDGGASIVRRKLGIGYSGRRPEERAYASGAMASTYIKAPGIYERLVRRKAWQYWVINENVRANVVSLDGGTHFLMNTKLRSEDTNPDVAAISRYFMQAVGERIDAQFISHTPWTAGQALVADSYGRQRVLLAGDAVHLFTPTGGFGMNTGVDDVANLGWKLAATVQGWGGPRLLASYEQERRPIAFRNTAAAKRMSLTNGEVPVGAHISEDSAAGERDRAAAAAMLSGFGDQFASLGVQLGAHYSDSPIVRHSGGRIADDPNEYVPTSDPGGRAPHAFLGNGVSLYDLFGKGFTLLCLKPGADVSAFRQAAAARRMPLAVANVDLREVRDLYACDLALVRPDHHVAWRGDDAAGDADAVLAQATGWLG
ncbi:FAD-dependent monooxygenase [Pigmentiphaga sp.]|uniref:FAD-dependent monooxygenase n=1 Tax=Pigmentiphaga sp. TaxID=1977564 RepID=UPI0025EB8D7F|nr:FAD-dependent monooxygenase [Pigmentiphaga sp.]